MNAQAGRGWICFCAVRAVPDAPAVDYSDYDVDVGATSLRRVADNAPCLGGGW